MARWAVWLSTESPPYAAIHGLMTQRMVALDKQLGVCSIGIRECWLRGVSKTVLQEFGAEAKTACGKIQLCAGLEAVIEGALHACAAKAEAMEAMLFNAWEVNNAIKKAEEHQASQWPLLPIRRP